MGHCGDHREPLGRDCHLGVRPAPGRTRFGDATSGDLPAAFGAVMSVNCGPDYRKVLSATLSPDRLALVERDCGFFFTDEVTALGEWRFDERGAAEIGQPVLVQEGADSIPVHRLVAHLSTMIPNTEVATVDGENHLLPLRNPAALGGVITEYTRRTRSARVVQR